MTKRRMTPFRGSMAKCGFEPSQGENHRQAKLNDKKALEIWNLRGIEPATVVGPRFGVSPKTVQGIWNLRAWTHVTFARRREQASSSV